MQKKTVLFVSATAVLVLILAVAGLIVWHLGSHHAENVESLPQHAAAGQFVAGFPQSLVLDSAAQVVNSYSIRYAPNTNQYTAEWSSPSSTSDVYESYQSYAKANGWTITNQASANHLKAIYARAASSTISVMITPDETGTGSNITVSYLTQ